jgi:2-dehydropantoate 2-reductase
LDKYFYYDELISGPILLGTFTLVGFSDWRLARRQEPKIIDKRSEVFVVGAGGVGCAVGYALRAGGFDVVFVESNENKVHWGSSHGVGLNEHTLPARFVHFKDWQPPSDGIVLLCTKCFDNKVVLDRLPSTVTVIPIQNGFDSNLIERSNFEGIATFVSECHPQRPHTRITRPGSFYFGQSAVNQKSSKSINLEPLIQLLQRYCNFGLGFRRVANILPYKYTKLMYNAAISPLAATAGLEIGQLLTRSRVRKLFFALLRENYGILKKAKVSFGKIGFFHPDTVDRLLRWPLIARVLSWPISLTLRGAHCSMYPDMPKHRTEIDNYNGYLMKLAADSDCSLNRSVHTLVKRMERESLEPALHYLNELTP